MARHLLLLKFCGEAALQYGSNMITQASDTKLCLELVLSCTYTVRIHQSCPRTSTCSRELLSFRTR